MLENGQILKILQYSHFSILRIETSNARFLLTRKFHRLLRLPKHFIQKYFIQMYEMTNKKVVYILGFQTSNGKFS